MKSHRVTYNRGDGIITITVQDETGHKEASFKCNVSDKKTQKNIGKLLRDKYNIDFSPSVAVPIQEEKKGFFDY